MKLTYIAGRYRAKSINQVHNNIQIARQYAYKYWKLGDAVICPHMNTAFMDGPEFEDADNWINGDLRILEACDKIVMLPKWQSSKGAIKEHQKAKELNLEIIYEC